MPERIKRVTVSIPDRVFQKLERRRGVISRSCFISAMLVKAMEADLSL